MTEHARDYKLISAESHVSEPPGLWQERVDKRYRERAPRLVIDPPGREGAYFLYEGHPPHPIDVPPVVPRPLAAHRRAHVGLRRRQHPGACLRHLRHDHLH